MPGGVIQLISTGNHDVYLTGCPQITFFKKVYKKHTNFAIEAIEQEFNTGADFNSYISATLCRDADLLTKLLLEMKFITEPTISLDQITTVNGYITIKPGGIGSGETYYGTYGFNGSNELIFTSSTLNGGNPIFIGAESGANINKTTKNGNLINTITGTTNYTFTTMDIIDDIPRLAIRLIDYIELTIGGQLIDRLYGEWIDIWLQLSSSYEKWNLLENMIYGTNPLLTNNSITYLPIPFWFSKNYGLSLPMISLQYHEVKCNIQFKNISECYADISGQIINNSKNDAYATSDGSPPVDAGEIININLNIPLTLRITDSRLFGDYIFLDTDERRLFASLKQEYLIEQTQYSNKIPLNSGINVNEVHFNHPVKELFWFYQLQSNNNTFNYWDNSGNDIMNSCRIEFNGIERFKTKNNHYFRLLQPYFHHTGGFKQDVSGQLGGFYTYSFGLHPEQYQPTGTCNFSRINNALMYSNVTQNCNMSVYSTNYNVLRVTNGMAGLGYGN